MGIRCSAVHTELERHNGVNLSSESDVVTSERNHLLAFEFQVRG